MLGAVQESCIDAGPAPRALGPDDVSRLRRRASQRWPRLGLSLFPLGVVLPALARLRPGGGSSRRRTRRPRQQRLAGRHAPDRRARGPAEPGVLPAGEALADSFLHRRSSLPAAAPASRHGGRSRRRRLVRQPLGRHVSQRSGAQRSVFRTRAVRVREHGHRQRHARDRQAGGGHRHEAPAGARAINRARSTSRS